MLVPVFVLVLELVLVLIFGVCGIGGDLATSAYVCFSKFSTLWLRLLILASCMFKRVVIVSTLVFSVVRLVFICCVMSLSNSLKTSTSIVGLDEFMTELRSKGLIADRISL